MNDHAATATGAVVIGASVGAIEALNAIIPSLPRHYPFAVIIVVHVPANKKSLLADIFSFRCAMLVKEAEDKEVILPSVVYFAPANYHLQVEPGFTLSLSNDEPVLFSRPAIDVLFESAADVYGASLTGVILTGASSDGKNGLQAVCKRGGQAFVQNPETAEGNAMPRAALAACPTAISMSLGEISLALNSLILPK